MNAAAITWPERAGYNGGRTCQLRICCLLSGHKEQHLEQQFDSLENRSLQRSQACRLTAAFTIHQPIKTLVSVKFYLDHAAYLVLGEHICAFAYEHSVDRDRLYR